MSKSTKDFIIIPIDHLDMAEDKDYSVAFIMRNGFLIRYDPEGDLEDLISKFNES